MRSARFGVLLGILLLNIPVFAQQTSTAITSSPALKDPQAVSVLNQAINAAGGTTAIAAITDYSAIGKIIYNNNANEQGSVMLRGLGLIAFRLDANLPPGVRSLTISEGQTSQKSEDGAISHLFIQAPMFPGSFVLPCLLLANALESSTFSVSYQGLVQVDGHSAHEIQVQRQIPQGISAPGVLTVFFTKELFIDASTSQVVMTREISGRHRVIRQIHYSDYRSTGGLMLPFGISEEYGNRQTLAISLDQITCNSGLQVSSFDLQ